METQLSMRRHISDLWPGKSVLRNKPERAVQQKTLFYNQLRQDCLPGFSGSLNEGATSVAPFLFFGWGGGESSFALCRKRPSTVRRWVAEAFGPGARTFREGRQAMLPLLFLKKMCNSGAFVFGEAGYPCP